jgi:hypothetical protein
MLQLDAASSCDIAGQRRQEEYPGIAAGFIALFCVVAYNAEKLSEL